MAATQQQVDRGNADFWDELCGSTFAKQLGITDASAPSLARFDAAYLEFYPYLDRHLPGPESAGNRLLEVGLGYGTVGQLLAERGLDYHGLDIAPGPVAMMRHRLELLGHDDAEKRVVNGSVLELPFAEESFDRAVSIGCLHHTGDLPGAAAELHRVLRPGGTAMVMLYNAHSLRQLLIWMRRGARRLGGRRTSDAELRERYDRNTEGEPPPFTEFVSKRRAKRIFSQFGSVRVSRENFDSYRIAGRIIPRKWFLGNLARLVGADLYVTVTK